LVKRIKGAMTKNNNWRGHTQKWRSKVYIALIPRKGEEPSRGQYGANVLIDAERWGKKTEQGLGRKGKPSRKTRIAASPL